GGGEARGRAAGGSRRSRVPRLGAARRGRGHARRARPQALRSELMLERLTILSAALAAGVAAWLAPASIDIVGWSAAGANRVAVFAPLYTLWAAIAAALVLAILFWRYRAPARTLRR